MSTLLVNLFAACAATEPVPLAEIPFRFHDGFIRIEVDTSQAERKLNFLLDSGAAMSALDRATAGRLDVPHLRPAKVMGVGGSTTGFLTRISGLRAGPVELGRDYVVVDLGNLSSACTNGSVDGVIGADFFRGRVVEIDFEKRLVRLLPEASLDRATEILPLKVRRCGMLVPMRMNSSKPEWVRLDTGCASALQWVSGRVQGGCTERLAVALTSLRVNVTASTVYLGECRLEEVQTDLHSEPIFSGEKGLLGNGVFSRFRTVTVDGKRKRFLLGEPLSAEMHGAVTASGITTPAPPQFSNNAGKPGTAQDNSKLTLLVR